VQVDKGEWWGPDGAKAVAIGNGRWTARVPGAKPGNVLERAFGSLAEARTWAESKAAAGRAKDKEEFPHKANCPANNGDACRCGATNAAIEKLRGKATDSRMEVQPV
jgi:hypothetical protein